MLPLLPLLFLLPLLRPLVRIHTNHLPQSWCGNHGQKRKRDGWVGAGEGDTGLVKYLESIAAQKNTNPHRGKDKLQGLVQFLEAIAAQKTQALSQVSQCGSHGQKKRKREGGVHVGKGKGLVKFLEPVTAQKTQTLMGGKTRAWYKSWSQSLLGKYKPSPN